MRLWQRKTSLTLLGSFTILQFLQGIVLAGPVKRSRFAREVYPEIEPEKLEGNQAEVCIVGDVIYGADEPVPADQPCLKCKCQPPGVQCETTRCIKKPGCRAIHKPNKCCPEYQCECEHQGKLYANGERLETPPGGECRVCYCRGSEVQCADVSCYLRTDCEGSTVPGQCCPKYDHCPPKEPLVDRLTSYTTRQINVSSENDSFTTTVYDLKEVTHDHNNKLAETQTEPTLSQKTIDTQLPNETVEDYNKINVNDVVTTSTNIDELSKGVTTRRNELDKIPEQPKITIQEIIPEIKEIPITGPPKREVNLHIHQSIDEFSNKVEEKVGLFRDREDNINDLALGDTESDSSEISEIYHHPPPVLKIGDQLLFLKKGELVSGKDISTPLPVITIIGAEGLQRGTEDSSETNEDSLQVPNPNKDKDELAVVGDEDGQSNASSTPPTHVISFVKPKRTEDTTKSILSTIEYLLANLTKVEATSGDLETFDFLTTESHSVESENVTKAEHNETSSAEFDLLEAENITLGDLTTLKSADLSTLSTESDDNQTTIPILDLKVDADEIKAKKHEEVAVEQNPEYPPIPDVMSPLNLDESEHVETELPHEPKLPKQLTESTSSVPEGELIGSNSSSLDELITTEATLESRHPLINLKAILPTSILTEVASSDFLDGASEEVNSTSNYTSEEKSKETLEETSTEDSGENTTPKGLIVSPIGDASVENYEAHEVNKKELLEVVPEVTNATIEHESSRESEKNETELKLTKDVELIDPKSLIEKFKSEEEATKRTVLAVETVTEGKRYPTDPETDKIFKQLNDELKTVAPRVLKHLTKEEEEAEIFKELLEDATSTPSSNGGDLKEAQLMEKVSTAINKFQKKETKEPLDASIMKIIKEFFTPQLKLRGN